ncbi:hypothetical protein B0H17DRAFT_1046185 [Mycena rosella]|uniref:Arrestin-like N-terminal domain-containing protein n=1 Tax=Mycena rosella TaxID=1033263 RepID=A0AAD7DYW9_MYCRO|nr:hypothetical protein B0H17DRAFT_1046185 [Mycena rosella]
MSLLRDVLKRGKAQPPRNADDASPLSSKRNIKSYASSIKSTGGASMRSLAESMFSFYSVRRRADFSRLDPPFTAAHSTLMHATSAGAEPWLGVVLYSHAPLRRSGPLKIAGEVRMVLAKPANFSSIDVWFVLQSDSVIDMLKPAGDPRAEAGGAPFKGKFPAGSFVLPFEFPALPADTLVKHPDEERRKNKARVPLPPTYSIAVVGGFSGNIKYTIGVNVTREGLGAIDEEFGVDVQYLPLSRPLPRLKTPFPYLPTREDWPFAREEVVEIEGILGIQEPAVYTAGQTLEFSLMLWSANALALEALAQPGAIAVGYYKSDIFALDALNPRNSARKNRRLERLAEGRVWLTDAGRPADDAPAPACMLVELPEATGAKSPGAVAAGGVVPEAEAVESDTTLTGDTPRRQTKKGRTTSGLDDFPDTERVVRLDGEVRVPRAATPASATPAWPARYFSYVLHLLITHPQYAHISPSGTGVVAEVPVWYALNRFGHLKGADAQPQQPQTEAERAALPVKGAELAVGDGAVRMPTKMGQVTTQKRPTSRVQRVAAF